MVFYQADDSISICAFLKARDHPPDASWFARLSLFLKTVHTSFTTSSTA